MFWSSETIAYIRSPFGCIADDYPYTAWLSPFARKGLQRENFARITMDFDGSVQSAKGHAEAAAIGYNKKKKGSRSYYPLFCTVAQTGQFFDVLHRPGNVHDSNGADQFMLNCFTEARAKLKNTVFESRMDSAFFNRKILSVLNDNQVKFTASVPFERFCELKGMIENTEHYNTDHEC